MSMVVKKISVLLNKYMQVVRILVLLLLKIENAVKRLNVFGYFNKDSHMQG